ncbi:MAG: glucosidase [Verrucomicrobiota bacterium]
MNLYDTVEGARLKETKSQQGHWNRWGPFLAERAWGTVREDYSATGEAWEYFPHDHARSRAYRWNEDGLAGICDRHQYLCFALALWNGRDPILKERMFGLTCQEGNHGEDVKEYWFYTDNLPSHAYMRMVYKYPQSEYPYARLAEENRRRGKDQPEFELVDTGIFAENRYFDVAVEYAKASAEDILVRISITNRGPDAAALEVLPTLWFRNTWSWGRDNRKPVIRPAPGAAKGGAVSATHWELGEYVLECPDAAEWLFTENETNAARLYGSAESPAFAKDAFHRYIVNGERGAVNPDRTGTKAAARCKLQIAPGATAAVSLRLRKAGKAAAVEAGAIFEQRRKEAEEFYGVILPGHVAGDERLVARQAFAGMLWSKQYYHFVISDWLEGDPAQPKPPASRLEGRNREWVHLFNRDVISMPDKWEFPWFASWDLAFHCVTLACIDPEFAKQQILLMLREWYMHPNGQIPAYEWDFNDVNPPVLPLAARAVFEIERHLTGEADFVFMEKVFQKMLLNFTWWVNRKDALGKNIFQGGFLGMDNIGAFDRGKLPPGYMLGQADGTSWMAAFAKSMMSTALLLAERNPAYEDLASKFWEHFVYIANSMNHLKDPSRSLWDPQDGFFYDHLISDKHEMIPIRARTMVGFVPLFGISAIRVEACRRYPAFDRRRQWFVDHRPDLVHSVEPMVTPGPNNTYILGLVREDQLRSMLRYMLDEKEFLSPYGIRSVSQVHRDKPLVLHLDGQEYRLDYEPGESETQLFGGNSNWRGPIWLPVNFLILMSLRQLHIHFGDGFKVECPTGSGNWMNLNEVALEIAKRVQRIFIRDENGRRAVFGDCDLFQKDPAWRDLVPFHEYFHGDTGRGCGASHQTGWTGMIAQILMNMGNKPMEHNQ